MTLQFITRVDELESSKKLQRKLCSGDYSTVAQVHVVHLVSHKQAVGAAHWHSDSGPLKPLKHLLRCLAFPLFLLYITESQPPQRDPRRATARKLTPCTEMGFVGDTETLKREKNLFLNRFVNRGAQTCIIIFFYEGL